MHLLKLFILLQDTAALLIAAPVCLLLIECVGSLFPRRTAAGGELRNASVAVLVPAHNESALIAATIQSIVPQLGAGDRLIVIADNCSDDTGAIAIAAGAQVLDRVDPQRRGKGYALGCAVDALRENPPGVVIVCDADLEVPAGAIASLCDQVLRTHQPAQAQYILSAARNADAKQIVSALAFLVKNSVRPGGLDRIGMPVPLTGTGMAFPWIAIAGAQLAGGDLVEDMRLGVSMLRDGFAPRLCRPVTIRGLLPASSDVALQQRTRWEHGHLGLLRSASLPLFFEGMRRCRISLIVAALDYAVPPLSLLLLIWAALTSSSLATALTTGITGPLWLNATAGATLAVAILLAWRAHAAHLPLSALLNVPFYVVWKLPIYIRFVLKRQTEWIRTPRPCGTDPAPLTRSEQA